MGRRPLRSWLVGNYRVPYACEGEAAAVAVGFLPEVFVFFLGVPLMGQRVGCNALEYLEMERSDRRRGGTMAFGATLDAAVDSTAARKARGAFFTPPEIARYIARWAIRRGDERVLEPSCGEAQFLIEAARHASDLDRAPSGRSITLVGCELHGETARAARRRALSEGVSCTVRVGDFLCEEPRAAFDAVIGNPPYVRFQKITADQREAIDAIARRSGVAVSALTSLWMPFVLHATTFLKPGGRLGMVLPAELLSVNYAASLRQFLLDSFSSVRLVTFEEAVFPEVQEEVVLLLADGWHCGSSAAIAWQQCADLEGLSSPSLAMFSPLHAGARWSGLFATKDSLQALARLQEDGLFGSLEQWGRIALGGVTGKNSFFVLSASEKEQWGLLDSDVAPLCPPGSKHLRRLSYTAAAHRAACAEGRGVYLFRPSDRPSDAALRYIERGEEQLVHTAYKCRVRSPWWRVPLPAIPDAFVTYMNAYGPSICANGAGVALLNSCHGLYFHGEIQQALRELLPIACLNSATMLGAEIEGRSYGGGMLKLEPREAAALPVPSPQLVARCASELQAIRPYVEKALEKRDFDAAVALVDAILIPGTGADEASFAQMKSCAILMRLRRKKRSQVKKVGL